MRGSEWEGWIIERVDMQGEGWMSVMTTEQEQAEGVKAGGVRRTPEVVEITDVTQSALEIIHREELPYLPVVAEGTDKLVGVVMRKGLELGCRGMRHDPESCPVSNHLKIGVEFWFDDDPLDAGIVEKAKKEPVVVVDRDLKPLGIVKGMGATG